MSELSAEVRPISHDVAVAVAALLAGRIDGQQAVATLTAQAARLIAEAEQRGSERVAARVEAAVIYGSAHGEPFCYGCDEYAEDCSCPMRKVRAALKDGTP